MRVWVGDVGGTHSRYALYEAGALQAIRRWPTASTPNLAAAWARWQAEGGQSADAAVIAVAGPVIEGSVNLTNGAFVGGPGDLPFPTLIVNDLQAAAAALPALGPNDALDLGGPAPIAEGPAAVMGVGTGLGAALSVGGRLIPGEAGHADFAPASAEQVALRSFLARRASAGRVTVEDVCSGRGLAQILHFVRARVPLSAPFAEALDAGEDAAALVCRAFEDDDAAGMAADLFVRCVASEAKNMALRTLPTGGLWLVGGIAPRLAARFCHPQFREAFEDGAPMGHLLARIPVRLVVYPEPGLLGAGRLGQGGSGAGPH